MMQNLLWYALVVPLLVPAAAQAPNEGQQPLTDKGDKEACPNYANYATFPQ